MRSIQVTNRGVFIVGVLLRGLFVYRWSRRAASGRLSFHDLLPQSFGSRLSYRVMVCAIVSPLLVVPVRLGGVQRSHQTGQERAQELVVVMDISYSMSAQDVGSTRSSLAHQTVNALLETISLTEQDYLSVGVVYFAGTPLVVHPVSTDLSVAQAYIEGAVPEAVDQSRSVRTGTAMGEAMILADAMFTDSAENRSLVLLSDGGVNTGTDPEQVVATLLSRGVVTHTVAVGTGSGGTVSVPTAFGTVEQNAGGVDRESLQRIAQSGGGEYFGVGSVQQAGQVESLMLTSLIDQTRYITDTATPVRIPVAFISGLCALLSLLILWLLGVRPSRYLGLLGVVISLGGCMIILAHGSRVMSNEYSTVSVHGSIMPTVQLIEQRHREHPGTRLLIHDVVSGRCVGPSRYSDVEGTLLQSVRTVGYPCEPVPTGIDLYQGYSTERIVRLLDGYMSRWMYTLAIGGLVWFFSLCAVRYE